MLGSKTFLRNENFSRNCTTSIENLKHSEMNLPLVFQCQHPFYLPHKQGQSQLFSGDPEIKNCKKLDINNGITGILFMMESAKFRQIDKVRPAFFTLGQKTHDGKSSRTFSARKSSYQKIQQKLTKYWHLLQSVSPILNTL